MTDPDLTSTTATQWAAVTDAWEALVTADGLTPAGLAHIREELRGDAWTPLPPHLRVLRGQWLDAVCRGLAALDPTTYPLEYFRSVGDLIDPAPDDASSISRD